MTNSAGGVAKTSKLIVPGGVLVVMGPVIPRPLNEVAHQMSNQRVAAVLFLGTDAFRLCFFVGVTLLIIGSLRNRRWRREAEAARHRTAP